MSTPDPTPALLPPARLAEIRERAQLGSLPHVAELLAHLDALTPRAAPDGEALGRAARRARYESQGIGDAMERAAPWEKLAEDDRAVYVATGLALHAIGYAAGRSEGEVERASLHRQIEDLHRIADEEQGLRVEAEGTIARLTSDLAAEREAHRVASAALHDRTAELAEARATGERAEQAMRLRDASLSRVEADRARKEADARLAGAREERRRLLDQLSFFVKVHTETEDERGRGEGQGS